MERAPGARINLSADGADAFEGFAELRDFSLEAIGKAFAVPPSFLKDSESGLSSAALGESLKEFGNQVREGVAKAVATGIAEALGPALVAKTFFSIGKPSKELAEDSFLPPMEPLFSQIYADAISKEEDKALGDKLSFEDLSRLSSKINEATKKPATFVMSKEASKQVNDFLAAIERSEERRREEAKQRAKDLVPITDKIKEIEERTGLSLNDIKEKIEDLSTGPLKWGFDADTPAMRVTERIVGAAVSPEAFSRLRTADDEPAGGMLVPGELAGQVQRIVGERSIMRQMSQVIPMEGRKPSLTIVDEVGENKIYLDEAVKAGWDFRAVSVGWRPAGKDKFIRDLGDVVSIPEGAIVAFDGGEIPDGWEVLPEAENQFIRKKKIEPVSLMPSVYQGDRKNLAVEWNDEVAFARSELLEVAMVPLPTDPLALSRAVKRGPRRRS